MTMMLEPRTYSWEEYQEIVFKSIVLDAAFSSYFINEDG